LGEAERVLLFLFGKAQLGVITRYCNELQRSEKETAACDKRHGVHHLKGECHIRKN
jgi:hypothetical protein